MKNPFKKLPESIIRLIFVFTIFIGTVLLIRAYVIPPSLKETGYHRISAIKRELSREIRYAGSSICLDCHENISGMKRIGYHKNLSCETCHGPAFEHTEDPDEYEPPAPRERQFCPLCHNYDPSRPTGFPQINPAAHNPLDPCISCHDPHDPKPSEVPHDCMACHTEIARTKAVSPHVLLECTICHATPEKHKTEPRLINSSMPKEREFCATCHGEDSTVKKTPKIDLLTHNEKYLCWQCHYPHMPKAR